MKTIKVKYSVKTNLIGSRVTDIVEFDVPIEATEEEINDIVKSDFEEWVWQNIDCHYNLIED